MLSSKANVKEGKYWIKTGPGCFHISEVIDDLEGGKAVTMVDYDGLMDVTSVDIVAPIPSHETCKAIADGSKVLVNREKYKAFLHKLWHITKYDSPKQAHFLLCEIWNEIGQYLDQDFQQESSQ